MTVKEYKKITTVVIILVVGVLMFASFLGVKFKKNEQGQKTDILPSLKLGMEFKTKRVITAKVDDTVTEIIKDAEGNIVEKEEGVEYTEEAGYTTQQIASNEAALLNEKNFKKEKSIIEERFNKSGITEYFVDLDKTNGTITIEIPEDDKADQIEELIKNEGSLELWDGETLDSVFDERYLKKAEVVYSQGDLQTGVFLQLEFNEEGTKKLQELSKIYVSTTEKQINEDGEEEEVTNSKVVWVILNGAFLGPTEINNIMYNDKMMLTLGISNDNNEIQTAIKNAQEEAILLNSGTSPITYNFTSKTADASVNINTIFIYTIAIGLVFIIMFIYLVVKFKAVGFISVYFQIGFIGVLLLVLKLTNVTLTVEGMAGIVICMLLEYVFTYIVLTNMAKQEEAMYKKSNLTFFLNTIPIYIISVVFTFAPRAHISSFGMTIFWGIILIYVYNFIFPKFIFENLSGGAQNENS